MLSKEEIEKTKNILNNFKFLFSKNIKENTDTYIGKHHTKVFRDNIETLLQYIDQLEQENNKLNKINNEMAMEIASYDNDETFCKEVYPNNSCEGNGIPCWDCIKQYFEKKVEEN